MLIRVTLLCALLTTHLTTANAEVFDEGVLEVIVNAAKNNDGEIEVALMNNTAQFNSTERPIAVCRQRIEMQKTTCQFKHLKHGEYAIFAYHDENKNQKLDENFLGAPQEKLAVSGIDLSHNQAPSFLESKFNFRSQIAQVFINLQ